MDCRQVFWCERDIYHVPPVLIGLTFVLTKMAMAHYGEDESGTPSNKATQFVRGKHLLIHRQFKEGFRKLAVASFVDFYMHVRRQEGLALHIGKLNDENKIELGSRAVKMKHGK